MLLHLANVDCVFKSIKEELSLEENPQQNTNIYTIAILSQLPPLRESETYHKIYLPFVEVLRHNVALLYGRSVEEHLWPILSIKD
jgi:hypothetical protein